MFAKHGQGRSLRVVRSPLLLDQRHHINHRHVRLRDFDMKPGFMSLIDVVYHSNPKEKCHRCYSWVGLDEVGYAPEEDGYTSW